MVRSWTEMSASFTDLLKPLAVPKVSYYVTGCSTAGRCCSLSLVREAVTLNHLL